MKIQEADAKSLLLAQGLPVPGWEVARTPAEARAAAERILAGGAERVVVKAQVLVGGRGKAGGVKLAGSPEEAEQVAAAILASRSRAAGPQGPGGRRGRHRQGVLPRGRPRPGEPADPRDGLGRGRRRDRGGRRGSPRGDPHVAGPSPARPARLAGAPARLRDRARRAAPAPRRGDRPRSRPDDARQRRRPGRGQPARDRQATGDEGRCVEHLVCLDAKITLDDSALPRHPELEALRDPDSEDPADVEARAQGISFIASTGRSAAWSTAPGWR